MRKNLLLLVSVTVFYTVTGFSQSDSILNSFTFRTGHYRVLTANAGGGFNSDKTRQNISTSENNGGSGSLNAGYSQLISTDKILQQFTAAVGSSWGAQRSDFNGTINKNNGVSGFAQFGLNNQWFSGQRFFELGVSGSGQAGNNRSSQTSSLITNKTDAKNLGYGLTLQLGYGRGRLENITDMQNALWLVKALQEENRLTRALNAAELLALGRSITRSNNTRILDFRKQRQFQLETVDGYLQEKGLISKNDITYFSNLNDILFFAFNSSRLRGTEKFIRLAPSVSGGRQNYENNTSSQEDTKAIKSAAFAAGLNRYKPQRLTRQLNYGMALKASYTRYEANSSFFNSGIPTSSVDETSKIGQAGLSAFIEQAFYPNTRTIFSIRAEADGGYINTEIEGTDYRKFDINASMNYFISYRTRLTGQVGFLHQRNIYNTYQQLSQLPNSSKFYAGAGLSVSL
jgi:hypothetical protein